MARGINNWSYKEVTAFLEEKGFMLSDIKIGSHELWTSPDKKSVVNVNRRKDEFPVGTMKAMIAQSNIDQKEWRRWAGS